MKLKVFPRQCRGMGLKWFATVQLDPEDPKPELPHGRPAATMSVTSAAFPDQASAEAHGEVMLARLRGEAEKTAKPIADEAAFKPGRK